MNRYVFPEGIVTITKEEMQEVLSNYDIVEIPGTVREVNVTSDASRQVRAREIALHEGTVSIRNTGSHRLRVNIPDTLMEMEGMQAPKISCLPLSFHRAYHISGIEYLQAYPQADVRYPWDDLLKHFVLLGDELPYIVHRFEHVPDGCVIHVESEKMAETVLKYVDADKIYVIPDAAEWRGFPAAVLEQQYNPESLLTARQVEIRRENQARRDAEEEKKQEKLRQEGKARSIKKMVEPIIMPLLEGLLGAQETVIDWRYQETLYKYSITVTEGKSIAETIIQVKATVVNGLSIGYYNQYKSKDLSGYAVVLSFAATDFPKCVPQIAGQLSVLRDYLDAHRDTINRYRLIPGDEKFRPECSAPGVMIPFMDNVMIGSVGMETIGEDVVRIKGFVAGLEEMIRGAREMFPLGFRVVAVEK